MPDRLKAARLLPLYEFFFFLLRKPDLTKTSHDGNIWRVFYAPMCAT